MTAENYALTKYTSAPYNNINQPLYYICPLTTTKSTFTNRDRHRLSALHRIFKLTHEWRIVYVGALRGWSPSLA